MSCPTCDHTMQSMAPRPAMVFWCPRCGTVKTGPNEYDHEAPALVTRCRDVENQTLQGGAWWENWKSIGVHESIRLPADRE